MPDARLIRRNTFTARHHYGRRTWSDEENARAFGEQAEPHDHDWVVEVQVVGPIDEETGFLADLLTLDDHLAQILHGWHGGDLNTLIPEVRSGDMQPSTESISRWIYERIAGAVPPPARIDRVAVWESEHIGAEFPA